MLEKRKGTSIFDGFEEIQSSLKFRQVVFIPQKKHIYSKINQLQKLAGPHMKYVMNSNFRGFGRGIGI